MCRDIIETLSYSSFFWSLGTTSFRTKEFNYSIEKQLACLDDFWKIPENSNQGWEKKYMAPGQKDIYDIKNRYYDFMRERGLTVGDDAYICAGSIVFSKVKAGTKVFGNPAKRMDF